MHQKTRKGAFSAALLLGALTLGACERELPTDIGGEHLPESSLRTYEIILQDEAFLIGDTLVRGFGTSDLSSTLIVAENWRDTLDAHALVRFADFPETVTYSDSNGAHTDTITRFIGGRIVVRLDTVALRLDSTVTDTAITFEMYELAEAFDARTATWQARIALPDDTTLWMTPGGTPGDLIGTQTWTYVRADSTHADSVSFALDSALVSEWATGSDDDRAILITTTTNGARTQIVVPRLALTVRLDREDTAARVTNAVVEAQRFVYDPPPPAPVAELRVGDNSAWRSFITFAPGLDSLEIPCPDDPAGCSFLLGDVTVNRAELRLTALEVPEVWRPRANIALEARPLLGEDSRPLERAPLGDTTGIALGIEPETFAADGDSIVRMGVSRFVRGLLTAGSDTAVTDRNRTLALLTAPEPIGFGIARFGGFGTEYAPVLRLIVTLPPREEEEE